jgi:hypothetical protein
MRHVPSTELTVILTVITFYFMEQICSVLNGPEKCIRFTQAEKRNEGRRISHQIDSILITRIISYWTTYAISDQFRLLVGGLAAFQVEVFWEQAW